MSVLEPMRTRRLSDYWTKYCVLNVNATETAALLGMSRLTITHYYREFRALIAPQRLKRGLGPLNQPGFGIVERNGQVYTDIAPDCKKANLPVIIWGKLA